MHQSVQEELPGVDEDEAEGELESRDTVAVQGGDSGVWDDVGRQT